jgi:ribosome-interacting GTPase 1
VIADLSAETYAYPP